MLRVIALRDASTATIRNLVSFNPNALLKYRACQLPTNNVIVETSPLATSERAKLAAYRQMPEGCREEDTAQIKICMVERRRLLWLSNRQLGIDRSNSPEQVFPNIA